MKLRRIFSIFLCVCLLLPVLAGCVDSENDRTPDQTDAAGESTSDMTTAPTEQDTTLPITDPMGETNDDPSQNATDPTSEENTDPTESTAPSQDDSDENKDGNAGSDQKDPADSSDSQLKPDNGDGIYDVGSEKLPYTQQQIYEQLFDINNKIEIDLDMSNAELQKLQDDYDHYRSFGSKSPIYRKADLTMTITTSNGSTTYRIREVGLRMKGNTSRTDFYSAQEGIYKYIHFKLDFQETFDDEAYYGKDAKVWETKELRKERKNRTFATLEKLELRWNKCYDSTYLKETYAYELYRSEGVLAPHTNLCSLDWSDLHMGIYTVNEPVDEVFLEKYLPAADLGGDLYKCGWTNEGASFTNTNSIGIEDEDKGRFYVYDLKSNKKTSTHQSLKNLINQLNSGSVTKERFGQLVDTEYFVSFAAVSYFLGNPDDLRNNYNNFYLYFLKSSGKAIFIPYDYDRCLGITVEYNPSGHAMTKDNPFSDRRESQNASQDNPLYIYSVDKGGYYVSEYADALNRVAGNTLLTAATFEKWFNIAKRNYSQDVNPSKTMRNAEGRNFAFDLNRTSSASSGSNMSFKDYITAKMSAFRGYMENVDSYIGNEPLPSTRFFIRGDFNDWSNRDEYAMKQKDGKFVCTLSFSHEFRFKVYDDVNQLWFGEESLSEDNSVSYTTDKRGNIKLSAGTYTVAYDPETGILTLTKQ